MVELMDRGKITILYHGNCADGFGGAYAAWKLLGETATYIGTNYGETAPELTGQDWLYLIDFSYPREQIMQLKMQNRKVVVLDHHKSAQAELAGIDNTIFDMDRSGAMIAWEFFHPTEPAPALIKYVQDRDLWRFELPASRQVSAALWSYPMDFQVWDALSVPQMIPEGAAILRYMQQQTEMICSQFRWGIVGGFAVPVVNATSLWSEVGEELLKRNPGTPFVASWYDTASGVRKWSLRSEGDFDVSAVAQQFPGGGGHRNAAGFAVKRPENN